MTKAFSRRFARKPMNHNSAHCLRAAVFAVVVTGGPAAAQTAQPVEQLRHPPMEASRSPDGSIRRSRNSIVTGYWSGYAVTASAPYTSASGTFQVPSVTYDGLSNTTEYVSQWVGIGGYVDSTLIQLGAMEYASTSDAAFYLVWYELYPAGAVSVPRSVKPGDVITASLQCTTACSPSSVQTWQLSLSDQTAGWSWTQSFQYQSSMASAEWITEAPGWPTLPLADYGQATFDPVEANGLNPNLSLSANGVIMQDPHGETSNPSAPVNGDVFSTCWGNGAFTPCIAASSTTPPAAPTASLSANPKSITAGQSSTLTWSSTNADSCTASGFSASGTSGSAVVHPTVTTSYSVTCTGNGGAATALATVTMSSPGTCHGKKCR
jgi:peptidase A4-like protein